jgi:hypothetical protein
MTDVSVIKVDKAGVDVGEKSRHTFIVDELTFSD